MYVAYLIQNITYWSQGSSAAVPITMLLALLGLWIGASLPLTFIGAFLGQRKGVSHTIFSSPEPKAHRRAYSIPMVRRPSSGRLSSSTMLKHLLLRNRSADQSQILCGASLGRGNEILFAASGSHDQDGRHAHIW